MFNRPFRRRAARAPAEDVVAAATRLERWAPLEPYSEADRARDFRAVLTATPAGRRVLAQILVRCRVLAGSHVPGDALETARREGMRAIGLWLVDLTRDGKPAGPAVAAESEPVAGDRS